MPACLCDATVWQASQTEIGFCLVPKGKSLLQSYSACLCTPALPVLWNFSPSQLHELISDQTAHRYCWNSTKFTRRLSAIAEASGFYPTFPTPNNPPKGGPGYCIDQYEKTHGVQHMAGGPPRTRCSLIQHASLLLNFPRRMDGRSADGLTPDGRTGGSLGRRQSELRYPPA